MKRIALQNNTVNSYHSLRSDREYALEICEELGRGASCITYRVRDKSTGLPYILKECFPLHNARRSSSGEIVWENDAAREIGESKITKAYEIQKRLQSDGETANDTVHLTDGLLSANNTLYMLIDPRNAETYDRVNDGSVQDTYKTAKAIARAVGAQHRLGYLNLDIKPENILVYPQTREMVMLLDFDSLVEKTSLTGSESISYSVRYAAPEQLQGSRRKICEATDIYAVGAVVFERIFGKTPEACDRSVFSDWDLSACKAFDRLSGKAERLTKEFLKKTLSADISYRYQNTDELIEALDELITECDPKRRHLNSTVMASPNHFVGRKNEISQISNILSSEGCQRVFLRGIGGIGKTEITLRYAALAANDYDTICFGRYSDSLANLFCDDGFISIENNSETGLGFKALNGLTDSRTLLIIDNLDTLDDPDMDRLLGLNCKMLITSRCDFSELYPAATHIDVHELDPDEQKALFIHRLENSGSDFNQKTVEEILRVIQGYTLLIPLIADVFRRGTYTLEEIAAKIRGSGVGSIPDDKVRIFKDTQLSSSAFNILCSVLDMSSFSAEERYVMDSISLLNGVRYDRKQLLDWIGREYNNALNGLAEMGWLQSRGAGSSAVFTIHGIIYQTYLAINKPSIVDMRWFTRICNEYIEECDKIAKDAEDCLEWRKKNGNLFTPPKKPKKYTFQEITPEILEMLSSEPTPKPVPYPEGWNNFSHLSEKVSLEWITSSTTTIRLKHEWRLISSLLNTCEKTIISDRMIDVIAEVCKYDVFRAYNFLFDKQNILNWLDTGDTFYTRSSKQKGIAYYNVFLIYLSNLVSRGIARRNSYSEWFDSWGLELSADVHDCNYATIEDTEKIIQYANNYLRLCGSDTGAFTSACMNVVRPCIEAGISEGLLMFQSGDFYNYNHEMSKKFLVFVDNLMQNLANQPDDSVQKEVLIERYKQFLREMSADEFNKQEARIENDYEIFVSQGCGSKDYSLKILKILEERYENANDTEKPKIHSRALLEICEMYLDPSVFGLNVDCVIENKEMLIEILEELDKLDCNEADPGWEPYFLLRLERNIERELCCESHFVPRYITKIENSDKEVEVSDKEINTTVEYVYYALEREKYGMILSYIIGDYQKSKERLKAYLAHLLMRRDFDGESIWDDGGALDELIYTIGEFRQLGTSTEYKELAKILLKQMEDHPSIYYTFLDYYDIHEINYHITENLIKVLGLAGEDAKAEHYTIERNQEEYGLGFYI